MKATMHDLKHSRNHGKRTRAQEIAIGLKESGMSRKPKRKVKRVAKRRARKRVAARR